MYTLIVFWYWLNIVIPSHLLPLYLLQVPLTRFWLRRRDRTCRLCIVNKFKSIEFLISPNDLTKLLIWNVTDISQEGDWVRYCDCLMHNLTYFMSITCVRTQYKLCPKCGLCWTSCCWKSLSLCWIHRSTMIYKCIILKLNLSRALRSWNWSCNWVLWSVCSKKICVGHWRCMKFAGILLWSVEEFTIE